MGVWDPREIIILPVILFFLKRQGKRLGYLLCYSLFFAYMWAVVKYTIFPFPLRLNPNYLGAIYRHLTSDATINWIPAVFSEDLGFDAFGVQVYGNFLLGVPFGFGLPFVVKAPPKRVVSLGLVLALGPELIQLVQNIFFIDFPFRTVDIDDVWVIFTGVLSGYAVLRFAAYVYQRLGWTRGADVPIWEHFHCVLLDVASARWSSPSRRSDGKISASDAG